MCLRFGHDRDGVRDGVDHLFDRQGWTGLPELISTGTTAFTQSPEGVINQTGATTNGLLADGLGTIRNVTDPTGGVTGSTAYDVFGEVTTQTGTTTPYGYTGARL